jgi:MYXO-CTERM domain-containing protein
MTVDPVDDCTFWYTQELYPANGVFNYDTRISSMKFPRCAANDFTIALAPTTQSLQQGRTVTYTVTTTLKAGTAESVALYIQDLPTGVTSGFVPTSITAGTSSTLTLTASASAAITTTPAPTFTVIGKATSAVHPATAKVAVVAPSLLDAGTDASTATDASAGGGTGEDASVGADASAGAGADASTGAGADASIAAGDDASTGAGDDASTGAGEDASTGTGTDSGALAQDSGAAGNDGGPGSSTGSSNGCSCRAAGADRTSPTDSWAMFGFGGLAVGAFGARRRRSRASRRWTTARPRAGVLGPHA